MKKNSIVILVALILMGSGFAVYYFFGSSFTDDKTVGIENSNDFGEEQKKQDQKSNQRMMASAPNSEVYRYEGDYMFKIQLSNNSTLFSTLINDVKGVKFKSSKDNLFHEISVEKGVIRNINSNNKETVMDFNDIGIIINNFMAFFKGNFSVKYDDGRTINTTDLDSLKLENELLIKIFSALKDGGYIGYDNSKRYKELYNGIVDNDYGKLLIESLSTMNQMGYLKNNNFFEDLKKELLRKGSYKMFFNGNEGEDGNTYLSIKPEFCNTIGLLYNNEESYNSFDIEGCKLEIEMFNNFIDNKLFVVQDGENESITYDGKFFLNMSYSNGKLLGFKFDMKKVGFIKLEDHILSIDIEPEILKMTMNKLSIKGKIDLTESANGSIELDYNGTFGEANIVKTLKDGKIEKINGKGNFSFMSNKIQFLINYEDNIFKTSVKSLISGRDSIQIVGNALIGSNGINISVKSTDNSELKFIFKSEDNLNYDIEYFFVVKGVDVINIKGEIGFKDGFIDNMSIKSDSGVYRVTGSLENGVINNRIFIVGEYGEDDFRTNKGFFQKSKIKLQGEVEGIVEYTTDIEGDMDIEKGFFKYGGNIKLINPNSDEEISVDFNIDFKNSDEKDILIPVDYSEIGYDEINTFYSDKFKSYTGYKPYGSFFRIFNRGMRF